ncbi:MAG: hypothetical protein IT215_08715 [Chitinophagaceae bacterium]|nr:hypothetical protein [Chitinophagaceae bacterium]
MAKLTFSHEISEKRKFGQLVVNQTMVVSADYDPEDGGIDNIEVDIYQDGKHLAEISKLLDKAEGNPLITIIEAINWDELYAASKEEQCEDDNYLDEMFENPLKQLNSLTILTNNK